MRILFVRNLVHPRDLGGNRYPYEVTRRLARRGHDVRIITGSPTRMSDPQPGLRVLRYPTWRGHALFTFWTNALFSRIATGIATLGWTPDVIVLSSYDVAFGHGIPRWSADRPTAFIYHSLFHSDAVNRFLEGTSFLERITHRSLRRFIESVQVRPLAKSDIVIAVSEYSKREIEQLAPSRQGPTLVISTGVDLAIFGSGDRGAARDRLGLPREALVLLVVGRLVPVKRFDRAIQVLRILRSQHGGPWRLLVVGEGPEGERLRAIAAEAGVADLVSFDGHRIGEELLLRHHAADLQLCTSEFENWSLSLLEGLASGHIVVGTPTGGTPDLLKQVDPMLVVADELPQTMADAVVRLIDAPQRMDALRRRGISVARTYSWDAIVERLDQEFTRVANAASRSSD
jgi:glycosyltransferase involved in cell wall biosynthesis